MKHALLTLALLLCATSLFAQAPQPTFNDELLDHFTGQWILSGTIAGKQTTHDVSNDWVLNHQYLRFHEVSREKNAKGEPQYEAMVFLGWDQARSRYVAIYLDIWGGASKSTIGYAPKDGDTIHFLFTDSSADSIHCIFFFDRKANQWTWNIDNDVAGKRSPFARLTLRRP